MATHVTLQRVEKKLIDDADMKVGYHVTFRATDVFGIADLTVQVPADDMPAANIVPVAYTRLHAMLSRMSEVVGAEMSVPS